MIAESIHLERIHEPSPPRRPEPDPLFNVAERISIWKHHFGEPTTDREWIEALEAGLIQPPQPQSAS